MPLGFLAFHSSLKVVKQACEGLGKLIDGAHRPVMQIFKKQNRELPYTSCFSGKPVMSN